LEEVEALVVKLAKDGNAPSRIGVVLRDQYGIPLVKTIVGKGVVEILKENDLGSVIPEDMEALLRKAARLRAHLERNRTDKYNKKASQKVESKVRRTSEYYKRKGVLPKDWKYVPTAITIA
jgi:small subunit ribosomal protein S15